MVSQDAVFAHTHAPRADHFHRSDPHAALHVERVVVLLQALADVVDLAMTRRIRVGRLSH